MSAALPPSWAAHARHLAERDAANTYYREVRRRSGCGRRSASAVAWLALPWGQLCVPMGTDPHVACDDECEDGAPLGDVVPWMWGLRPLSTSERRWIAQQAQAAAEESEIRRRSQD